MKDLKRERIFQQSINTLNRTIDDSQPASNLPLSAKEFKPDTEFTELETLSLDAVEQIETIIRPSRKSRLGYSMLAASFGGLVTWQLGDMFYSAYTTQDWLSLGWAGFVASLSMFGLARIIKELRALRKLRHHFTLQEQAEDIIKRNSVGQAESFCYALAKNAGQTVDNSTLSAWKNQIHDAHSDAEVFDLYDNIVMKQQDQLALNTISKYSSESAILVAISPLAIADMLLVGWRSLKMVDELSAIYGVSLGYWARIRLLKSMVKNMAFAGATELAIDSGMDMLSASIASKLSARAGQGIGVGILNARLGVQALTLLRPLPWFPNRNVKLAHVRKQIIDQVKTRLVNISSGGSR
jgi:putative membrane protein